MAVGRAAQTRERILSKAEALVLRRGFAGTSLDDIVTATNLTKGAFFHHFRAKADLATAMVERYRRNHQALFERFAAEADAASEDPLVATFEFLKRFEYFIEAHTNPLSGCVFAACTYQDDAFDAELRSTIAESLERWRGVYEARFATTLRRHAPRIDVSGAELAEMIVVIIQGGLILSRSLGDAHLVARQSRQFRNYLLLLFDMDQGPNAASAESG
jgi:TetR/AcrR family transcriptional repressor of nem operon